MGFLHRYADFVSRVAEFRISNIQNSPGSIKDCLYADLCAESVLGVVVNIEDLELCYHQLCHGDMQGRPSFPVHLFLNHVRSSDFSRLFTQGQQQVSEEHR